MIDLTGMKFGHLTVTRNVGRNKAGYTMWELECDCNSKTIVVRSSKNLHRPNLNCGCIKSNAIQPRHGHATQQHKTPEYISWRAMHSRCENPNHRSFHNYGGRGITICDRWHIFENFLEDMGPRPGGTTLDRIDPDGGYNKDNCRWADWHTQRVNRRSNTLLKAA